MKGVRQPGYLDEFMWREHAGENKFEAICREISRFNVFCVFSSQTILEMGESKLTQM